MSQPKKLPGFGALVSQFQTLNLQTLLWRANAKANAAELAPIRLRITLDGQRIERSTGIRVSAAEWDVVNGRIRGNSQLTKKLNEQLQLLRAHVSEVVNLMKATGRPVTIRSLRANLEAPSVGKSPCFIELCQHQLTVHYGQGPVTTLDMRQYGLDTLRTWHAQAVGQAGKPLTLDEFTPDLATTFYHWLLYTRKVRASTANSIIGTLGVLFRLAVRAKVAETDDYPFRELLKKKKEPVERLRLSEEQLAALRTVELSGNQALARDVYMAQYYLHGSRIGAVLKLRWQDVTATHVRLKTEKGGSLKTIAISPELARVLARYQPAKPSPAQLVFPVLPPAFHALTTAAQFKARHAAITKVNDALRKVAAAAGLPDGLHSHTARHTLATHAALKGGMRVAQAMLGHASLEQTERYVGKLPSEVMRAAEAALYGTIAEPASSPVPTQGPRVVPMWAELATDAHATARREVASA